MVIDQPVFPKNGYFDLKLYILTSVCQIYLFFEIFLELLFIAYECLVTLILSNFAHLLFSRS